MTPIELSRFDAAGGRAARRFEFERLVEPDVEPWTREQRGELTDPVCEQGIGLWVQRIEIAAVLEGSHIGIAFDAEEIVKMAVQFDAGNHVDVALARVVDDAPHLILAVTALRVQKRVALQLDGGFGVEVILVGLEAREKVELPPDLILPHYEPWLRSIMKPR